MSEFWTVIDITAAQNVRVGLQLEDFVGILNGNSEAFSSVECYLKYANNVVSDSASIICMRNCSKGVYYGSMELRNKETGVAEVRSNRHKL